MRNRWHRTAVAEAERLGLTFTRTNSRGFDVWEGPAGAEFTISPGIDEHQCRDLVRRMQRATGTVEHAPGRSPAKVKARQARERAERAREREKHEARLEHLRGAWNRLSPAEKDEVHAIESRLQELRELERQMKAAPVGAKPDP